MHSQKATGITMDPLEFRWQNIIIPALEVHAANCEERGISVRGSLRADFVVPDVPPWSENANKLLALTTDRVNPPALAACLPAQSLVSVRKLFDQPLPQAYTSVVPDDVIVARCPSFHACT